MWKREGEGKEGGKEGRERGRRGREVKDARREERNVHIQILYSKFFFTGFYYFMSITLIRMLKLAQVNTYIWINYSNLPSPIMVHNKQLHYSLPCNNAHSFSSWICWRLAGPSGTYWNCSVPCVQQPPSETSRIAKTIFLIVMLASCSIS